MSRVSVKPKRRRGPIPGVAMSRVEARLAGWLAENGLRESSLCQVIGGRSGRGILKSALSRKFRFGFNVDERDAVLAWARGIVGRRVSRSDLFEGAA